MRILLTLALALPLAASGDDRLASLKKRLEAAAPGLLEACGATDPTQLDAPSEECKAALRKLLPQLIGTHRSRLLALGSEKTAGGLRVYVTGADEHGEPFADWSAGKLEVTLKLRSGERVRVAPDRLVVRDSVAVQSWSSVLDYSGSMSDADVDRSVELFDGLYSAATKGRLESDVTLFSTDVHRKLDHTSDLAALRQAIARDHSVQRGSTALYDAMGEALQHLATRPSPTKLLVVSTDGRENASRSFNEEQVVALARKHGVRIAVFATLTADREAVKRLTERTGGFFVYAPSVAALVPEARKPARMLATARALDIRDERLVSAVEVEVRYGAFSVTLAP